MISEMISFARETGFEIISLGVKEDNTAASALYKKMGFVVYGRYKRFFKINGAYYDEILMSLEL